MIKNHIRHHNVLQPWPLPSLSVDCIVTSPPYWGLRDYGHEDQIGQEKTPEEYVGHMVQVFTEAFRVLKDTGTLWLNLGDTYWGGKGQSGGARTDVKNCDLSLNADGINYLTKGQTRPQDRRHPDIKPKDIVGIPWMVAFALRSAGWYLRSEIIWAKPNCMPESVSDRPTRSHETIFLLTKQRDYYYDAEAIKEQATDLERPKRGRSNVAKNLNGAPGQKPHSCTSPQPNDPDREISTTKNKRDVWTVPPGSFDGEYCTACGTYFDGPAKRRIREWVVTAEGELQPRVLKYCTCGRADAWLSHFATFPPDLITDCIKAGSSQHGNCASCGSPWERIIEKVYKHHEKWFGAYNSVRNSRGAAGNSYNEVIDTQTTGWQPTCSCGTTEVTPAIILDPFMGSGTTALTARELGRDFVGMDLNEHYIAMAKARLRAGQQAHIQF